MKLYIADEEKINTYTLPQKPDESFLFSYTSSITNLEVFFNVYAKDNNWYIKNNEDFMVNDSTNDLLLTDYNCYKIKIKGIPNTLSLFTYDSYNDNYQDINIEKTEKVTIGSDQNCSISYNNALTNATQAVIKKDTNNYSIEINPENITNCYVNNRRIKTAHILMPGDTLFINNLKLIFMINYIRVFIPNNVVTFSSQLILIPKENANNQNYLTYDMKDNGSELYGNDDYFFHSPRLSSSYEEEELKIDPPTQKKEKEELPAVFTMTTGGAMIITSFINLYKNVIKYKSGKSEKMELIFAIVTAVSMLIFSFFLPKITQWYNKRVNIKSDKKRAKKYEEYLLKKQNEIIKILSYQKQSLFDNNPSSKECYDFATGMKNRLWEREITDKDFLTIRVGLGNIQASLKINAPEEKFTLDEDELINRARQVAENSKLLQNVPITVSLCDNFISSIICNFENSLDFMNGILLQLMTLHNPKDLKIVLLTTEKNAYKWDYLKLSPHIYSEDRTMRYYATNEDETKNVLKEIENIYNDRKEEIKNSTDEINEEIEKKDYYKSFNPYYLIITDNHKGYKNIDFLEKIITFNKNIGFSLLIFDDSLKNIPNECNKYTYVTDKASCIFEKDYSKNNQINFTTELFNNLNMYKVSKELSEIPIQSKSVMANLPNSLNFLEMYNVGNIEQLNISNKWSSSNPISSLSCPIGVSPSGELFKLDLHEKTHGPHGLIAGSTGSGKSEFIITYILSMCINYHPYEVQFVLIDYKGGGLAGAFENKETGLRIPHLSGTITNLDVSEMNRTLVSINSELKRRQQKFNEARDKLGESTIDIYKYQKYYREGLLTEPISHLFIISDEFAELKSQQPDFMDELISTARIGRSLGVHLVLATQKPSGVVNDQIWSNSRFKICLKVQTKADSMEMLKRPEAASIKETGRFYLQVGYDELFELGQSAWTGAPYIPTEKVVKKVDDSVEFIDNLGNVTKTINNIVLSNDNIKSQGDQITNIVKYLSDLASKNNIKRQQLWLDSIPAEIYLSNLLNKYNYKAEPYIIDAIIGEYDDPAKQVQGLLKYDLTNTGNVLMYGIPGSGKENAITTLITSICTKHTSDEVNIYILDFGAETLGKFKDFPQVGDIVYIEEKEKITSFISLINKEISKRKNLFSDYNGSYVDYIKYSGKKVPNIIVIIHQLETINDTYPLIYDKLINLIKDAPKFGITFFVTNSLSTGIRFKVLQLFPNKLSLKLNDDTEYRMVLDSARNKIPRNYFGRGIAKNDEDGVEFQTAYIAKPEEITSTLLELSKNVKALNMKKAPKIPTMPDFFLVDSLLDKQYDLTSIPVGISKNKLNTVTYNFNENYSYILSTNVSKNIHFIYALIELLKQVPGIKIRIIDILKLYNNTQGVLLYNDDFDTLIQKIKYEIQHDKKLDHKNVFIIIGLGAFKNNVTEKTQKHFTDVFKDLKTYDNNKFIIYDDYNSYRSLENEEWYKLNVNNTTGIWLDENAGNQFSLKMPNLSLDERKIYFNQIGYVVTNSSHNIIRYIVDKELDNEK